MPRVTELRLFAVDLPFKVTVRHAAAARTSSESLFLRRIVETGQRADGQFKILRLTSDTSFAAEFATDRDLTGSQRTKT